MKSIFLILSLSVCRTWTGAISPFSVVPFRKDIPENEYPTHIYIRLVWKNWKPKIEGMPDLSNTENPDDPLDKFPGEIDNVLETMDSVGPYENCGTFFIDAIQMISDIRCQFNRDLDSIMIFTTLSGHGGDGMTRNIVLALAMRNMLRKYNVFVFDMSAMEKSMGVTGANSVLGKGGNNYKRVSRLVAEFVKNADIRVPSINLIGFCYSGQLVAHIARTIRKENNGMKINSVLSLDPFSLGFARVKYRGPSADDAEVVHTYHTNSLFMGTLRKDKATADIEFNGSVFQPGCGASIACSHQRSFRVVWYLIIYPNLFVARKCKSWWHFMWCNCIDQDTMRLTFPPSGDKTGRFQIRTSGFAPYGVGMQGADTKYCAEQRAMKARAERMKEP